MEQIQATFTEKEIDQLEKGLVFYVAVYPSASPGYLAVLSEELHYAFESPSVTDIREKAPQLLLDIIVHRKQHYKTALARPLTLEQTIAAVEPCEDGSTPQLLAINVKLPASRRRSAAPSAIE